MYPRHAQRARLQSMKFYRKRIEREELARARELLEQRRRRKIKMAAWLTIAAAWAIGAGVALLARQLWGAR